MEVDEVMIQSNLEGRWSGLRQFLSNNGPCSETDFEPDPNLFDMIVNIKILVIGAGGLGCELLKDLAMTGYKNISVIDMDTIDLSNLNRQFLFRASDIGQPKATVAAEFIKKRVPGCNVTPYFNKIQDFDADFYRGFNIVICGLDSVVARRWINGMLVGLLEYNDNELDQSTIIPIIDGGTEGFKGNARVIMPGLTACIECNLDLYPKQVNFPLCTLAETPRLPEHCIEYIKLMVWPNQYPFGEGVNIDGDDPKHIQWICDKASERANLYGIVGVNYRLTQGVIKHIIPAVASTNAVIAAMCANEVMKILTFCYKPMNNYTIFNDSQGIYTYTFEAEKKDDCPACSQKPINIPFALNKTLEEFIEYLKEDNQFQLKSPGLTTVLEDGSKTLYIPNIPSLEQATRPNLTKSLQELNLSFGQVINVTDSVSPKPIVFILKQPDD